MIVISNVFFVVVVDFFLPFASKDIDTSRCQLIDLIYGVALFIGHLFGSTEVILYGYIYTVTQ